MSKADRIAKAQQDAARAKEEQTRIEALREIERLVPRVMAALAARDYAGSWLVTVQGRVLSRRRAAWVVYDDGEGQQTLLLSTGKFASRGGSNPAHLLSVDRIFYPERVLAGLKRLAQE